MSWINQKQCWGESWADVQRGHASYHHSYTDCYLFFAFDCVNHLESEAERLRLPFYGLSFTSQGPLAYGGIFCKFSMTDNRFSNAWVFHQLIGEWNSLDKDRMVPKGKNIHELSLLERSANSCSKSHWTLPTFQELLFLSQCSQKMHLRPREGKQSVRSNTAWGCKSLGVKQSASRAQAHPRRATCYWCHGNSDHPHALCVTHTFFPGLLGFRERGWRLTGWTSLVFGVLPSSYLLSFSLPEPALLEPNIYNSTSKISNPGPDKPSWMAQSCRLGAVT